MKKVIQLGKVAYSSSRKVNAVDLEIALTDGRLSICGNIWNAHHTDIVTGGQIIDQIADLFPGNSQVQLIHSIWKKWHLNYMKAGSPAQECHLKKHSGEFPGYPVSHYEWASKLLAEAGLNPDPGYLHNGKPYKYGTAWLRVELPADVVAYVEAL